MLNVLIAETEEMECYEVIGVVGSESEARELAAADMRDRERKLEADMESDGGNAPMPVYIYKMHRRGVEGYVPVLEILATEV